MKSTNKERSINFKTFFAVFIDFEIFIILLFAYENSLFGLFFEYFVYAVSAIFKPYNGGSMFGNCPHTRISFLDSFTWRLWSRSDGTNLRFDELITLANQQLSTLLSNYLLYQI